jgi:catechol 2,3-dioxygenase-like lactoylglutathione lyase family enzyme
MECIEKNFPWAAEFDLDTPCWNERTNAFYKRLGYQIIKVEDGFIVKKLGMLFPDIEYVNRLMTHSWGQRVVRFYDPDGNLIEVGTPV